MPESMEEIDDLGVNIYLVWSLAAAAGVSEPWTLVSMDIMRASHAEFVVASPQEPKELSLSAEMVLGFLTLLGFPDVWRWRRIYMENKTLHIELYCLDENNLPIISDEEIMIEEFEAPLILPELAEEQINEVDS